MRILVVVLILGLPGALSAQKGYVGILGGRTTTELVDDTRHFGSMAGAFFQVDLDPHVGFRTELAWTHAGALPGPELGRWHDSRKPPSPVDLDFAELHALGRLSWATSRLQPPAAELGLVVFGGGWLGTRIHGRIAKEGNRHFDFGHLLGLGLFWSHQRFVLQVDARSHHGERALTPDGPKRRGSQLVFGLGYRIQ